MAAVSAWPPAVTKPFLATESASVLLLEVVPATGDVLAGSCPPAVAWPPGRDGGSVRTVMTLEAGGATVGAELVVGAVITALVTDARWATLELDGSTWLLVIEDAVELGDVLWLLLMEDAVEVGELTLLFGLEDAVCDPRSAAVVSRDGRVTSYEALLCDTPNWKP